MNYSPVAHSRASLRGASFRVAPHLTVHRFRSPAAAPRVAALRDLPRLGASLRLAPHRPSSKFLIALLTRRKAPPRFAPPSSAARRAPCDTASHRPYPVKEHDNV